MTLDRREFLDVAVGFSLASLAPARIFAKADNRGRFVRQGDSNYTRVLSEGAWNPLLPARYPSAIARPRTVVEVASLVKDARKRGVRLAIKGTGHSYCGCFLHDGTTMIDMSNFTDVDIAGDIARVGPGVRSSALVGALAERGLAFPSGHTGSVGLGGYLLGGGMGWNGANWGGFACFGIRAVDVVTADARVRTINEETDPELFWAARGAGPAFPAIVTGFHLHTRPMPAGIVSGGMTWPLAAAEAVAGWLSTLARVDQPDMDNFMGLGWEAQPGRPPTAVVRANFVLFGDDPVEAIRRVEALLASAPGGRSALRAPASMRFEELYHHSLTGGPVRTDTESFWTEHGTDVVAILARHIADAPGRDAMAVIAFDSRYTLPTEAPMRTGGTFIELKAQWQAAADDLANRTWMDTLVATIEPLAHGVYVNETDFFRRPHRTRKCFTDAAWRRLQAVRTRYDPSDMFAQPFADGIKPAGTTG